VGDLFSNKEEPAAFQLTQGVSVTSKNGKDSSTKVTETDSSIDKFSETIHQFYQNDLNKELQLRKSLNQSEIQLAQTNLRIIPKSIKSSPIY